MRITFPAPAPTSASDQATDVVVATAPDSAKKGKRAKSAPLDDYTKSSAPGARLSLLNRLLQSKVGLRVTGGVAGAAILAAPVVGGVHSLMEDPRIASVHAGTQVDGWEAGDLADEEIPREEAKAYAQVGVDELEWMADLRKAAVSPAEISLYIEAGVADIDDMIDLAEHGVSASLMKAYASEGISDLDRVKDLVEIGISPKTERIYQHRASAGYDVDWERDLSFYTPSPSGQQVTAYADAGIVGLSNVSTMILNNFSPAQVKPYADVGAGAEAAWLIAAGISPETAKAYGASGVSSAYEMAELIAQNISPETAKPYLDGGFRSGSVALLSDGGISAAVAASYLPFLPDHYTNTQRSETIQALVKINVSGERYGAYREAGVWDPEEIAVLVANNISPEVAAVFEN